MYVHSAPPAYSFGGGYGTDSKYAEMKAKKIKPELLNRQSYTSDRQGIHFQNPWKLVWGTSGHYP